MRFILVFLLCLLGLLVDVHGERSAWGRGGSSRSSSSSSGSSRSGSWASRSSSSSSSSRGSSRSGSWASRPSSSSSSSSSSGRKSFGTKVKEKLGFGSRSSTSSKPGSWASSSSRSSSSYPKQQFGSSSYPISSSGSGFSQPKTVSNNMAGTSGIGGFSQPKAPINNFGSSNTGKLAAGGLVGAGAGGFAGAQLGSGGFSKPNTGGFGSSSIGGGGFMKPGSSSSSMNTPIGGGGFVQPKPSTNNFGGGFSNTQNVKPVGSNFGSNTMNTGNFGNQGFGSSSSSKNNMLGMAGAGVAGGLLGGSMNNKNVGSNFGSNFGSSNSNTGLFGTKPSSTFGMKPSSSKNNLLGMAGGGVAGGLLGGSLKNKFSKNPYGVSQYSGYSKPKKSIGSYLFGSSKKSYGYKTPGYGTNWGTNFAGGMGQYKKPKTGISKKALGLGIGAGFLGGAALGVAGTMATYSVYHKYQEFKRMMYMNQMGGMGNPGMGMGMGMNQMGGMGMGGPSMGMMAGGWDNDYYQNNYLTNTCLGGCPINSHCEWGLCECNAGSIRRYGRCEQNWPVNTPPRPKTFDPFQTCTESLTCLNIDMNLVCNTNLTTQGTIGKCECRKDMRWNAAEGECQIYLDVDCSKFTYETKPSPAVLAAVERGETALFMNETHTGPIQDDVLRTESKQESLQNSLMTYMGESASQNDLTEAFCRDIDAYSLEFEPPGIQPLPPPSYPRQVPSGPVTPGYRDEKPDNCDVVPQSACAVAYDSGTCSGGWKLVIPVGELRFRWFTSYWSYRNDMDTVGVRAGCTLTAYSDSSYNGDRIDIKATTIDRWVVFADHAEYKHMDSDIESLRCVCRY